MKIFTLSKTFFLIASKRAAACNPYIRLFDINSHHGHVRTFVGHTSNVMAVGFHADGNSMYSGSEDGTVRIWDLRYNSAEINAIVLHPNQIELISGDQDGIIRVWDTRMNSCTIELVPEPDTAIRSLSVMRDGTMLAAANDGGTCFIWNILRESQVITKFEPIHKLQAHDRQILKCVLSPDSKYLATASSDKTVKIWNVDSFTLDKVLTGHQRWVWDCAFSVDAKFILTASSDMTARLWSMEEGNELRVYRGHNKAIVCCALNDV
ncbi:BnaA09g42880D [Brassica napus]|uniref:Target of rapamycin complex subunit LST8 n=1 Tax=Brassica napus TaxID=3708 RepID=A0A078FKV4_BRANA|nr:BnaA09g42880D [Brassica napus]